MSARRLKNAAEANAAARACLLEAERQQSFLLAELPELEAVLAEKTARAIEIHDHIDELTAIALDAAAIICATAEAARQHALVEKAKKEIAAFVAERKSERAA